MSSTHCITITPSPSGLMTVPPPIAVSRVIGTPYNCTPASTYPQHVDIVPSAYNAAAYYAPPVPQQMLTSSMQPRVLIPHSTMSYSSSSFSPSSSTSFTPSNSPFAPSSFSAIPRTRGRPPNFEPGMHVESYPRNIKKAVKELKEGAQTDEETGEGFLSDDTLTKVETHAFEIQALDANSKPIGTRVVRALKVWDEPQVTIFENFLSSEECAGVLELAEGRWEPSKTSKGAMYSKQANYTNGVSNNRTSWSARMRDVRVPLIMRIESRVASMMRLPVQRCEPVCVLRYRTGEYFRVHHDGDFRSHTFLIYLNDVEEGGETLFAKLGFKVKPKKGLALCWPNVLPDGTADMRTLHAGLPPTKGMKYCIPVFINNEPINFSHGPL